jgi:hypothetical protein
VLLFGGTSMNAVAYDDTWIFDGVFWAKAPGVVAKPPARDHHAMAAIP